MNAHKDKGLEGTNAFSEEAINHYHRQMVQAGTYSVSFVNQSINAVKFYYQRILLRHEVQLSQVERPEKPERVSQVLSKQDVAKILSATDNLKHRCLLQLLYAGGQYTVESIRNVFRASKANAGVKTAAAPLLCHPPLGAGNGFKIHLGAAGTPEQQGH